MGGLKQHRDFVFVSRLAVKNDKAIFYGESAPQSIHCVEKHVESGDRRHVVIRCMDVLVDLPLSATSGQGS